MAVAEAQGRGKKKESLKALEFNMGLVPKKKSTLEAVLEFHSFEEEKQVAEKKVNPPEEKKGFDLSMEVAEEAEEGKGGPAWMITPKKKKEEK